MSKSLDKNNYISRIPFQLMNSSELVPLRREKILSKFSQEEINSCWESLCTNIIQNYQRGKGTLVKGFGTFTFKGTEINLEGTTNEINRDKKERSPIFLVSKEFNVNLKPGEYTKEYGIRYFTSKENKNIPISNINYTEIAFSLSLSKDKVSEIIKHLILYINESINKNIFKNKIMPGLGILILKQNILAVKFNKNFEINVRPKNKKLINLSNNISLDMCFDEAKNLEIGTCPDVYKTSENIKATRCLVTECQSSAKNFLKNKYNINILSTNKSYNPQNTYFLNEKKNNNFYKNTFFLSKNFPFTFINDNNNKKKNLSSSRNKIIKTELTPRTGLFSQNPLLSIDNITLKTISYFKGVMIKNCKDVDINKTGSITKEEAINMLMNNIPDINHSLAQQIVEHYFITDQIDYMKFIALLIKGSKNCFIRKKNFFNFGQFFLRNVKNGISTDYTSIQNNKKKKNINLKSVIQKQKDKKIAIIKNAEKESEKIKESENKNEEIENEMFFENKQKFIERNKKELIFIADLIPEIKRKYYVNLDQNINTEELMRILQKHDLFYKKDKLENILKFIEIKDLEKFSLREFINNIQICKLINASIEPSEFSNILNCIKDTIYIHGGGKFLFNNEINKKSTIDLNTFIKLLKEKSNLNENILENAFYYITKTNRDMTIDDYNEYFGTKNKKKIIYDEPYFINMMKTIILKFSEKFMNPSEYFDRLLSYNINTKDKLISRINWIKYLQLENFDFHAEELDQFFNWVDTKKDNVIDIDEFTEKYHYTIKPLSVMKNIIHNNKLDIEDLAHRMKIDIDEIKNFDYSTFLNHVKRLDYTLPESFIKKIFDELKQKDKITGKEYIQSKKFLDEINYVKPENYQSFTKKYIDTIKGKTSYEYLKTQFEKYDQGSLGNMTKLEYVKCMSRIFPEFNDDDHMRFIRIMEVLDKNNKVIYPEILNIIFYSNINKMNDHFTKICEFLLEKLNDECDNNVEKLMYLIEVGTPKKTSLNLHKPLTIEQVENFLIKSNLVIDKKVILKLDLDSDGLISYDDLYGILMRYKDTLYFKYYNNSNNQNINLFTKDTLSQEKIKVICEKLLSYMKSKNITSYGLFKKFDKDNNGLISNIDFNQGIKEILNINSALADPFFSYLDYYNIGMIDFETFNLRISSDKNKISENDRKEENEIIEKIKLFIKKNNHLSDNEIFQIMDKDCDGLINSNDLKEFIKNNLGIIDQNLYLSKIERIMMTLSLTKNLQIGFNDISEFIKISKENKTGINLKEIFKLTANQNLSFKKKNVSWINDIIERFGMYVSEKYDSIENFYKECVEDGSNKLKFDDFLRFHESHYDLFNNGFHLSKDELLSIFTSLDSQKKNYLTLQDLQNKLQYFNFYKKMHFDIKDFFQTNFNNGIDAFKYFFIGKNTNEEKRYYITVIEFFEGFESFFPKKYEYNTVLKYLNKYFNITLPMNEDNKNNNEILNKKDTIDFSEFNYIFFDKSEENQVFIDNFKNDTKLLNKRVINDEQKSNTEKNFYFSELFKNKKNESLITPFDDDPFNKLIRIISSSKYDINSFFEEAIKENNNNPYVNKSQFRNIIKKLNIGLTSLEIDLIIKKCSKEISKEYGKNINLKQLLNILNNEYNYSDLGEGIKNIRNKISEIKSLIYKYYSSPILCFQIVDIEQKGKIDFQKYRNMIIDLYTRNEQEIPNFALIKNTFDTIDLRKDGLIDYNEWSKSFSMINGKFDLAYEKYSNNINELNNIKNYKRDLRQWENSDDITLKYLLIYKNRKQIKNKLIDNNFIINKSGKQYVNSDTLILVIQKMLPNCKLSRIQWKMITNIGKDANIDNLVCISDFFKLIEIATKKNNNFKPYNSSNEFNKIYYGNFGPVNLSTKVINHNIIDFYGNKKNKEIKI